MSSLNVEVLLTFLECLVGNQCSASVMANYISAIKANVILYGLPFEILDHPKIKHFFISERINRPLVVKSHNVIRYHLVASHFKCMFGHSFWPCIQSNIFDRILCFLATFQHCSPLPVSL